MSGSDSAHSSRSGRSDSATCCGHSDPDFHSSTQANPQANQAALLESQAILTIRYFPGQALRAYGWFQLRSLESDPLRLDLRQAPDVNASRNEEIRDCYCIEAKEPSTYAKVIFTHQRLVICRGGAPLQMNPGSNSASARRSSRLLITGCGRSGTRYTSFALQRLGLDVPHERLGRDGISSWTMAITTEKRPFGPPSSQVSFEQVFHQVRDPIAAIASCMTFNPSSTVGACLHVLTH